MKNEQVNGSHVQTSSIKTQHRLKTARSLVLLLAALAATVTYQAGLNPPGGILPDDREGHKQGDPILMVKHAARYKVFFYCNSMAFAASFVAIFMVQNDYLTTGVVLKRHALEAVMVLDLIGLTGAYAAGCCRDASTSVYVLAMAGAVLVYVTFHMVFFTTEREGLHVKNERVEKIRKMLLLASILDAALTYQAGLTSPGGFWLVDDDGELGRHRAGDPVLLSSYPRRYEAFFYLNAESFMVSIALIVLLVNPNLYRPGIRCQALRVCKVTGLFCLMGAYAAGSSRRLRTSIYIIALIAAVFTFIVLVVLKAYVQSKLSKKRQENKWGVAEKANYRGSTDKAQAIVADEMEAGMTTTAPSPGIEAGDMEAHEEENIKPHMERRYLVLLGILAVIVTYQAGLAPPGGGWLDTFFYCNSTSFAASIVIVVLVLVEEIILQLRTEKRQDKDVGNNPLSITLYIARGSG
ncbi:hypothetical protein ACP4OV_031562 [Aristida adscensionis]